MVTDAEKNAIEEAVHRGMPRHMAVSDALNIVQKSSGWISDQQIKEIASLLEMTEAEVDSIATFYNMIFRRPLGRHLICLCDSVSCHVMESKKIQDHLQKRLGITFGQTTPDHLFTLIPCACLGHCEEAPVISIDGRIYGRLTPDNVDKILSSYQ